MKKCIICNSTSYTLIYNKTLTRCKKCNFVSANMTINEEQLKKIYNKNYFNGNEYLDYLSDKQTIQKNFTKRVKQLQKQKIKTIKAIEIGCAYGFFGEILKKNFKDSKYLGFDIVSEAIAYGKKILNLNLKLENYLTYTIDEKYTHVFMWDVIEHLPRPDLFIKKISKEIKEQGELHITTGNINALLPRIQKQNWRMIHPPSHLHYFSKKTITLLLEKYNFKVTNVKYEAIYRSLKQIFYSLFILNKRNSSICNKIFDKIPNNLFIPLNTFDIMHIKAIKK